MATSAATIHNARERGRPAFHLWLALAMSAFVFVGFGMSYLLPMATGALPPTPPVVHVHGLVYFAWMVLLVVQTALVRAGNVRLHRALGLWGIALASLLVAMGAFITILAASLPEFGGNPVGVFYLSVISPPSFAVLFALAIRERRVPSVHRTLMQMATIAILMPGINRVYTIAFALERVPYLETYLTMNLLLALLLMHERRSAGHIPNVLWLGAAIIVVPQLLFPLIVPTSGWTDFVSALGTLVYYR